MNHYDSPDPIILSVGEAEEVSIEQVAREIAGGGGGLRRDVACMHAWSVGILLCIRYCIC